MKIIAFGHRKRTGKDTAVKFALSFTRQFYPHVRCCRMSFGDQIKRLACQMFRWGGLQEAVYYENHPEERETVLPAIGKSPRQIWDEFGTFGATLCPAIWPELALQDIDTDVAFVPDLRRPVEIEYVRRFHGYCYRIDRDAAPKSEHIVDTSLLHFEEWDGILDNNGGLKELNMKIKRLMVHALNPGQEQRNLVCPSCYARGEAIVTTVPNTYECHHCKESYHG